MTKKVNLTKINYTRKDISPHMLLACSELALLSAYGDLKDRDEHTKKWRNLLERLEPLTHELHSIGVFLDYCFDTSALPENELVRVKNLIFKIIQIFEHAERPKVGKKSNELYDMINVEGYLEEKWTK